MVGASMPPSSLKKIFGLFEKALADRTFLAVAEIGKFLELGFLRRRQMRRNFDIDPHVQVAVAVALNIFNAFAFKPEHGARLGARRDTDAGFAIQRRDLYFRAQGRLDEIDRHLAQKIIAVALENFMR